MTQLSDVEARILGSLVEKSMTTPGQYPLTFNALLTACNQKSSRDPVMSLDPNALGKGVTTLIEKDLVERRTVPGSRVPKFAHDIEHLFNSVSPKEIGAITVLLLRGPQTPGEIKNRTDRLCEFAGTAEVEALLQDLAARIDDPIVARLPRRPGQKEPRYQHLFSGEVPSAAPPAAPLGLPQSFAPGKGPAASAPNDRVARLEERVETLEKAVHALQDRLDERTPERTEPPEG